MISMRSSARSALKLRDNRVKREQNPRHGHYNGLKYAESPQAAVVKSDGGGRCGKVRTIIPAGTVDGALMLNRKRSRSHLKLRDKLGQREAYLVRRERRPSLLKV